MSKLSKTDVEYIASLARLRLNDAEKDKFSRQLSDVLDYVELLKEVDTDEVLPTAQVTGLTNVVIDDVVVKSGINYKDMEQNAPDFENKSFKVPGVFQ